MTKKLKMNKEVIHSHSIPQLLVRRGGDCGHNTTINLKIKKSTLNKQVNNRKQTNRYVSPRIDGQLNGKRATNRAMDILPYTRRPPKQTNKQTMRQIAFNFRARTFSTASNDLRTSHRSQTSQRPPLLILAHSPAIQNPARAEGQQLVSCNIVVEKRLVTGYQNPERRRILT